MIYLVGPDDRFEASIAYREIIDPGIDRPSGRVWPSATLWPRPAFLFVDRLLEFQAAHNDEAVPDDHPVRAIAQFSLHSIGVARQTLTSLNRSHLL